MGSLLADKHDYLTAAASQGCAAAILVVSMTDADGLVDLAKRLVTLKNVPTIIVATKHDDVPARRMTMVCTLGCSCSCVSVTLSVQLRGLVAGLRE